MIKTAVLRYLSRKNEKKRAVSQPVDFRKSSRIGVIIHEHFENEDNVEKVCRELENEGKEVSKIYFVKNKESKQSSPLFKPSDISNFGRIKSADLTRFLEEDYDFLLCFDTSSHLAIEYVVSLTRARCRIGMMQPAGIHNYEMMVQVDQPGVTVSSEILKYLKMIQSYEY